MRMATIILALEPLRLVTSDAPDAGGALPAATITSPGMHPWWWWLGIVVCATLLAVGAAMLTIEYLQFRGETDADAAFHLLARRLGLRQREIAALLRLSYEGGIPPAALVLSEGAFAAALQAAGIDADDGSTPALGVESGALGALRRKLFSPESPSALMLSAAGSFTLGSLFARLRRRGHDEARPVPH